MGLETAVDVARVGIRRQFGCIGQAVEIVCVEMVCDAVVGYFLPLPRLIPDCRNGYKFATLSPTRLLGCCSIGD